MSGNLCARMYALYETYYASTSLPLFLADLQNKDYAILLTDVGGDLRGFSTLAVTSLEVEGLPHRAIFSGDTIVAHEYWGEQALAFAWIRLAGRIKREHPATPLYWFLIVKGHRTYRYLPAFSIDYYPTWSSATPRNIKVLMDGFASSRFGDCYDSQAGLLRFPRSRGHLRQEWAAGPAQDLRRPEVRFFLERNPGYAQGDELVCMTELHGDNLRPLARRLFLKGYAE
jgi:hypothetical protein